MRIAPLTITVNSRVMVLSEALEVAQEISEAYKETLELNSVSLDNPPLSFHSFRLS